MPWGFQRPDLRAAPAAPAVVTQPAQLGVIVSSRSHRGRKTPDMPPPLSHGAPMPPMHTYLGSTNSSVP